MKVYLYSLSKRNKSDLSPTGLGAEVDIDIKDECSVEYPELVFDFDPVAGNYNYFTIPDWHRSYFISESKYYHGRWFVKGTEDYLVSWRSEIKNTRAFVLYDNNTYNIVDNRIPTVASPTISKNFYKFRSDIASPPFAYDGTYVIVSTGGDGVEVHTTTSAAKLEGLLTDMNNWLDTLNSVVTNTQEAIGVFFKQMIGTNDVPSNIKSVIFLPFVIGGTENHRIKLGLYDTGIDAYKWDYSDILIDDTATVNIPWQASDWRRNSPYTDLYLYIPFIGLISYPVADLVDKTSISVDSVLNITTGEMTVRVYSGDLVLGTYGANTAAQVPIGSSGVNIPNLTTGIIKGSVALGAAIASGGETLAMGAIASGAASVMSGLEPVSSTIGGLGGGTAAKLGSDIQCITAFHDTIVSPTASIDIIGAPTMHVKSLASASGFVQTAGFQIACNGTSAEKDAINALMDSGVYFDQT